MVRRNARPGLVVLILLSLLATGLVPLPNAAAETTVSVMQGSLPTARDGTSAARAGAYLYIFGGDDGGRKNDILRYHPPTDTMVKMGATLPTARSGTSAVHDGQYIFIFGGWSGSGFSDQILRYDPATDTIMTMTAKLPSGRYYTSAVWAGDAAYIFGGGVSCSPCTTNQIVKYVPATDTATVTNATLPTRRYGTAAVWDGAHAYIFGGITASTSTEHADILRYDPVTGQVVLLGAQLPSARYHMSAAYQNGKAYMFGGYPCATYPYFCRDIIEFNPATGNVQTSSLVLPTGRYLTSAASNGTHVFVFGGYDGARTDQTLRLGVPGSAPVPNRAPTLEPIGDLAVGIDDPLTVSVHAADADGDTLVLSLTPLPGGATFTDHGNRTGTLAWTPQQADVGTYTFTAKANDGALNATRTFQVIVSGNPPPVLDPVPDRVASENSRLFFFVSASDPDGEPVTLSMPNVPPFATFRDNGLGVGTFDWNITFDQAGAYDLVVQASDDNTTISKPFRITVQNIDRRPVFGPAPEALAVEGQPARIEITVTDPDGDAVALTASGLPSGASFTDLGGLGRIAWTPAAGSSGVYPFVITATANGNTTQLVQSVRVVPPVDFRFTPIGPSLVKASPDEVVALRFRVENTGGSADTYTFTAHDTAGGQGGWLIQAPASLTLAPGQSAEVSVSVTVPPSGVQAKPRVIGTSGLMPLARQLTWVVDVPVRLSIALDHADLAAADLTLLEGVTGTVAATWNNGAPVAGITVRLVQRPDAAKALESSKSGNTDGDGRWSFSFGPDPGSIVPGGHDLTASVTRGGRTDSASVRYTVGAA